MSIVRNVLSTEELHRVSGKNMEKNLTKDALVVNSVVLRKRIGEKIALARKEKKRNQKQFADDIGMSMSALAHLEIGHINQIDTLCVIAKHTGKKITWFFDVEENENELVGVVIDQQRQIVELKKRLAKKQ